MPVDEEITWTLIRLWLDAALAARQLGQPSYPFFLAFEGVCAALGMGRQLTSAESSAVWNALHDAGYPGCEGWPRMEVAA